MRPMRKLLSGIVFGLIISSPVFALPDYDPFADATANNGTSYTVGANLIGQTNAQGLAWFATGTAAGTPVIAAGNLSIDGLMPASGNMVSYGPPPVSGTSARLGLGGPVTSGTLYYSFALQVTSISALTTAGAFIAGFNNSTASQTGQAGVVASRLYTRLSGSGFNLGINKANGTATDITWDSAVYNPGNTIFVVGSYTFNPSASDDVSALWINPDSSTFAAGSAPAGSLTASGGADITANSIASLLMREAATTEPSVLLDELRVGANWADVTPVPEPAVSLLGGMGALCFLFWRRLRSRG